MNALRIALTTLALVLDVLFIALCALSLLIRHLSPTQLIGGTVILVVLLPNVPALILALMPRRRRSEGPITAGVFE